MKQDYFRVGVFTSTHGIKGEINVFPTSQDKDRFDYLKSVTFDTKEGYIEFSVEGVKYFKNMVILKFKGVEKIEDIEKYKGCDILVKREDAIPLEEGEYYVADLLGLDVFEDTGEKLGILKDIIETGANDVYVIDTGSKDLLVPSIKECMLERNIEEGYIKVHLIEGLRDL